MDGFAYCLVSWVSLNQILEQSDSHVVALPGMKLVPLGKGWDGMLLREFLANLIFR